LKIHLLFVGKTKNQSLISLMREYERRLHHFCDLALTEIRPVEESETARMRDKEGEALLARIRPDAFVLALDPAGESLTSEKFAALIADQRDHSSKDLIFVIGNYWGLSNQVKKRANKILSLSRMTLNHEMTRLVLLEQIYRAFTLIHRIPYHK
jgi:23S rRNA (pseudouridine1915-N3)-methyltransferase